MGQLNSAKRDALNALLSAEAEAGNVIRPENPPSLNKMLMDAGVGAAFTGEVKKVKLNAVRNKLADDGSKAHVYELVSFKTGELCSFFAGNDGLKGKAEQLEVGDGVVVVYLGEGEVENPEWQSYRDYGIYKVKGGKPAADALAAKVVAIVKG